MQQKWLYMMLCLVLQECLVSTPTYAASNVSVEVEDAYIELRTGPGRGYPIFHVVEQGEVIVVKRRRTEWFEVESPRGVDGWVSRKQLELTLDLDGKAIRVEDASFENYSNRRWEIGVLDGDFGGADVISVYGSYALTPNLSAELSVSQGIGNFSDSIIATANVVHQFFPEKRITPFFTLGGGVIETSPNATLVQTEDRNDEIAFVGGGVRTYISRRLTLRLEYKSYVIFTSRDQNEEVDEWKVGFSFFF